MQLIVMNYGEKASMQAKKKMWIMVLKIQKSVETQQKSLALQATATKMVYEKFKMVQEVSFIGVCMVWCNIKYIKYVWMDIRLYCVWIHAYLWMFFIEGAGSGFKGRVWPQLIYIIFLKILKTWDYVVKGSFWSRTPWNNS